jgi:hypothetical protein
MSEDDDDILDDRDDFLICDDCGVQNPEVNQVYCPYQEDINGKKVLVNLCHDCYTERAMEI